MIANNESLRIIPQPLHPFVFGAFILRERTNEKPSQDVRGDEIERSEMEWSELLVAQLGL